MQSLNETRNAASSAQCAHDNKVRLEGRRTPPPSRDERTSPSDRMQSPNETGNAASSAQCAPDNKVRLEGRRTPPPSRDERTSPSDRLFGTPPLKRQHNVDEPHSALLAPSSCIALAQLDHMSTSEQMAVKCASVIGQTFLFKLLHHILPERSQKKVVHTLMSLVKSRIFECASPRPENRNERGRNGFCFCPEETTASGKEEMRYQCIRVQEAKR
ncbi:hypothetical protein NDU88_000403 [Pleurodeles waltl]|uniref:Uncharacterized protein n=1 Tax=Pleurodeles waltl TaxID=8319 RepID=A0AAV7U4J1_PLEWA|nr:hypothetical protein NDU88_000403 [Pleurodeles waltl]